MGTFANIGKRLAFLVLGTLILSSCVQEERVIPTEPDGETSTFYLHMPGATIVDTRGTVGSVEENKIANLWLLAFEGTTLKSKTEITNFEAHTADPQYANGNVWKFKTSIATGYTLVALANAGDKMSGIAVNMTKDAVVKSLYYTQSAGTKWCVDSSNPIPMWGELTGYNPTTASTCRFEMMRMLAKVNVDASSVSAGVFTLESIAVYNYNTKNYLVPQSVSSNKVSAVTVWDDATSMGKQSGSLTYSGSTEISGNKSVDKIYLFEAATKGQFPAANANWATETDWLSNPCLVIGGKFGGSSATTYYRVDFIEKDTDGTNSGSTGTKDLWHSLLRNHSYNVSVLKVDGAGYGTAGEALSSAPMNMDVSTYVYNESDKQSVTVDGPYYLAVEKLLLEFDARPQTGTDKVSTNYPSGWTAELSTSNTTVTTLKPDWISNITKSGDGFSVTLLKNGTGVARTAYVHVKAGRMSQVVTVTQGISNLDAKLSSATVTGTSNLNYVTVNSDYVGSASTYTAVFGGSFDIDVESNVAWTVAALTGSDGRNYADLSDYFSTVSGTGDQTLTFNVPVMINGQMSDNTYTITFKTADGSIVTTPIVITQRYPGIRAEKNIISIDNTGTLNLDGRGWIVHYKWGSVIAMGGGRVRNYGESLDYFDSSYVFTAPAEYTGLNALRALIDSKPTGNWERWQAEPRLSGVESVVAPYFENNNLSEGFGDPCKLLGSYKMPSATELEAVAPPAASGIDFAVSNGANGHWYNQGGADEQFYPAAGIISPSGYWWNVTTEGQYWTTTPYSSSFGYYLYMQNSVVVPSGHNGDRATGLPIRCIRNIIVPDELTAKLTAANHATMGAKTNYVSVDSDYAGTASTYTSVFGGASFTIAVTSNTNWTAELTLNGTSVGSSDLSRYLSVTSGSGSQSLTFTIPDKMTNGQMSDNKFSITFKNSDGSIVTTAIVITQKYPGVRAEPNIISIDNTGKLNLDGDGWIVYYKWGSVIAMGGGYASSLGDSNYTYNDKFGSEDLFFAPSQYNLSALRNAVDAETDDFAKWLLPPYAPDGTEAWDMPKYMENTTTNLTNGYGDPCKLLGNYMMPAARWTVEGTGELIQAHGDYIWFDPIDLATSGGTKDGVGGYWNSAGTQFYPLTGHRGAEWESGFGYKGTFGARRNGYYWASSDNTDVQYRTSFTFTFNAGNTGINNTINRRLQGQAVRCIQQDMKVSIANGSPSTTQLKIPLSGGSPQITLTSTRPWRMVLVIDYGPAWTITGSELLNYTNLPTSGTAGTYTINLNIPTVSTSRKLRFMFESTDGSGITSQHVIVHQTND